MYCIAGIILYGEIYSLLFLERLDRFFFSLFTENIFACFPTYLYSHLIVDLPTTRFHRVGIAVMRRVIPLITAELKPIHCLSEIAT